MTDYVHMRLEEGGHDVTTWRNRVLIIIRSIPEKVLSHSGGLHQGTLSILYYISITSYTGKYHEFVAVVLLRVQSMSNNAEGDKRVICFRYSLVLW